MQDKRSKITVPTSNSRQGWVVYAALSCLQCTTYMLKWVGGLYPEGLCSGGIVWGIVSNELLLRGDCVQRDFIQRDCVLGAFLQGGLCPGSFSPGGLCLGGFNPMGLCPEGFYPGGIVSGGFYPGKIMSEGILSGILAGADFIWKSFVQGDFI